MARKFIPKVSVLVPIYNVERYLRQCLDSLVNQTLSEIEIICLNDGSTDSSPKVIQEYAAKDPRIIVINKQNSGYGDSMNHGLEKARGEYIGIVESDDWIDTDAFARLYRLAKAYDTDIVRANYYQTKNNIDKKLFYIEPTATNKLTSPLNQSWIFLQAPAIWSAIYRKSFLDKNAINFLTTPGASYQDTGFNFKALAAAKKICFTTRAFIHYRTDNEASSVKSDGKIMNVYMEYADIEKFLKEKDLFTSLGAIMEAAKFGAYYWNMLRVSPSKLTDFLKVAQKEYAEAKAQGLLIKEYFDDPQKWKLVNLIASSSLSRIRCELGWVRLKRKLVRIGKKVFFTIKPSYVKQRQIADLIDELYSQNDLLEQQIKFLNNQICQSQEKHHE